MENKLNPPTMAELIEATREKPIRMSVPFPSSIALEDTEAVRAYVESEIRRAIEECFDSNA